MQVSSSSVALVVCGAVCGDSSSRVLFTFRLLETIKDNGSDIYDLGCLLGSPSLASSVKGCFLCLEPRLFLHDF